MPEVQKSLDAEQAAFDQEVAEIEAWWNSSAKQKQLKRFVKVYNFHPSHTNQLTSPYPASRIAALRSSIKQQYPSSDMALKLWDQMNEHQEHGTCDLTFGCTDPLQAGVMAKHQQVCNSSTTGLSRRHWLIGYGIFRLYMSPVHSVATPRSASQEWIMPTIPGTLFQRR